MNSGTRCNLYGWIGSGFGILAAISLTMSCGPNPPTVSVDIEFTQVSEYRPPAPEAETGIDTVPSFYEIDDGKVEALITVSGLKPDMVEVYHIVWLRPDGEELFRKEEEFISDGPVRTMTSSMTISPERERMAGRYEMKLYRHRRLLGSSVFDLRSMPLLTAEILFDGDSQNDTTQSEKLMQYTVARGSKVGIDVTLRGCLRGYPEQVRIRWVGPSGDRIFEKDASFIPKGDSCTISSSMGISPDRNRAPGTYTVELYRGENLLSSRMFHLSVP